MNSFGLQDEEEKKNSFKITFYLLLRCFFSYFYNMRHAWFCKDSREQECCATTGRFRSNSLHLD